MIIKVQHTVRIAVVELVLVREIAGQTSGDFCFCFCFRSRGGVSPVGEDVFYFLKLIESERFGVIVIVIVFVWRASWRVLASASAGFTASSGPTARRGAPGAGWTFFGRGV